MHKPTEKQQNWPGLGSRYSSNFGPAELWTRAAKPSQCLKCPSHVLRSPESGLARRKAFVFGFPRLGAFLLPLCEKCESKGFERRCLSSQMLTSSRYLRILVLLASSQLALRPTPPSSCSVFLAGNFNSWSPSDPAFEAKAPSYTILFQLPLSKAKQQPQIEFKFVVNETWICGEGYDVKGDGLGGRNCVLDLSDKIREAEERLKVEDQKANKSAPVEEKAVEPINQVSKPEILAYTGHVNGDSDPPEETIIDDATESNNSAEVTPLPSTPAKPKTMTTSSISASGSASPMPGTLSLSSTPQKSEFDLPEENLKALADRHEIWRRKREQANEAWGDWITAVLAVATVGVGAWLAGVI